MTTDDPRLDELLAAARQAARSAYCPYSHFRVGAAVLAGGRVHTGCNVENASYGLAMCAERTATFKLASEGLREIEAIAVACIDGGSDPAGRMPCGACRQVLSEFCSEDVPFAVDGVGVFRFGELLPRRFVLPRK